MADPKLEELEWQLNATEQGWHRCLAELRKAQDAEKKASAAHHAAQLALTTFLKVSLDLERERKK